jgi:hypothetical protein
MFKKVSADVIASIERVCTKDYMAAGAYDLICLPQLNALVRFGNGDMKHNIVEDSFINHFLPLKLMWHFGNREVKQAPRLV